VFFAGNAWPQSQTTYPGDNAVNGVSNTRCLAAFAAYDGIDSSVSSFTFDTIAPSGGSDWASGNREVICVAYESGTPVRYSIKGNDR
jgi:hypothetical protein